MKNLFLLPLLLGLFLCTCVRAQSTGPSLIVSLGFNSLNYGEPYPNSLRYGTYDHEGIGGPSLGIGLQPDLAKGNKEGTYPILTVQISGARLTQKITEPEVGGLTLVRKFGLTAIGGSIQGGASIPLSQAANSGIRAEAGIGVHSFFVFNEKRDNLRMSSSGNNTFSLEFSEGGNLVLGPFLGLLKESGRYSYGLRGQFLFHLTSKRGLQYPRSYQMLRLELLAGFRLAR